MQRLSVPENPNVGLICGLLPNNFKTAMPFWPSKQLDVATLLRRRCCLGNRSRHCDVTWISDWDQCCSGSHPNTQQPRPHGCTDGNRRKEPKRFPVLQWRTTIFPVDIILSGTKIWELPCRVYCVDESEGQKICQLCCV